MWQQNEIEDLRFRLRSSDQKCAELAGVQSNLQRDVDEERHKAKVEVSSRVCHLISYKQVFIEKASRDSEGLRVENEVPLMLFRQYIFM